MKVGDVFTYDGDEYEVYSVDTSGIYCRRTNMPPGYFYSKYIKNNDVALFLLNGAIKVGRKSRVQGGKKECPHWVWQKYVGLREVYRFCVDCGAKDFVDWRLIKDERDY